MQIKLPNYWVLVETNLTSLTNLQLQITNSHENPPRRKTSLRLESRHDHNPQHAVANGGLLPFTDSRQILGSGHPVSSCAVNSHRPSLSRTSSRVRFHLWRLESGFDHHSDWNFVYGSHYLLPGTWRRIDAGILQTVHGGLTMDNLP